MKKALARFGVVGLVLLIPAFIALGVWILMLVLGAVGHVFDWPTLYNLGFWEVAIVYLALWAIGGFFRSNG